MRIRSGRTRCRCALKDKFQALLIRKGHKRSIVAIGHKSLRTLFVMLKNGQPYKDSTINYEAMSVARNAPRWIKMLTKHGVLPTPA